MKEISKIVGIAVSRVSQIHAAAMVELRASLGHLRESAMAPPARAEVFSRGAVGNSSRMQA